MKTSLFSTQCFTCIPWRTCPSRMTAEIKFCFLNNYLSSEWELGSEDLFSSNSFLWANTPSLSESAYCRFSLFIYNISVYSLFNFLLQLSLIWFTVLLFRKRLHVCSARSLKHGFNYDLAYDTCYCTYIYPKAHRNCSVLFHRYPKQIFLLLWTSTLCTTPANHFTILLL